LAFTVPRQLCYERSTMIWVYFINFGLVLLSYRYTSIVLKKKNHLLQKTITKIHQKQKKPFREGRLFLSLTFVE
jgi:hypothetical protein